jgi:hypothetical protein
MTGSAKARNGETASARQKRVWDKSAPSYVQWLLERITIRAAGEHFTRRQLPLVLAAGFQPVETGRLKAGSVERIHAVKPA